MVSSDILNVNEKYFSDCNGQINELKIKINNELENIDKTTAIVQKQTPQPGIVVFKENEVFVDL